MKNEMQTVVECEIVAIDRDSLIYKAVMSEYLRIEIKELGEQEGNEKFESVNSEFVFGTKSIYKFDDGLERNVIQLTFVSPTFVPDSMEYSNHIQNWSLFACEEDGKTHLLQSMELHTFCMHEGGH